MCHSTILLQKWRKNKRVHPRGETLTGAYVLHTIKSVEHVRVTANTYVLPSTQYLYYGRSLVLERTYDV